MTGAPSRDQVPPGQRQPRPGVLVVGHPRPAQRLGPGTVPDEERPGISGHGRSSSVGCNRSQLYGSARYSALTVSTQGLDNSVNAQHCNRSQVLFGDVRLPRQRPRPRPPRLADRGGSMKKTSLPRGRCAGRRAADDHRLQLRRHERRHHAPNRRREGRADLLELGARTWTRWSRAGTPTHPDIQVTVNKQDGGDPAVTKLLTAIKAGSGAPDVMQAEYQKIPTLVSADALADIAKDVGSAQGEVPRRRLERRHPRLRGGLRRPAGLRADDVLLPRRRLREARPHGADHLGRVRRGRPQGPRGRTRSSTSARSRPPTRAGSPASPSRPAPPGGASRATPGRSPIDDAATQKVADYWGGLVQEGVIDNKPMYTPEWNAALNDGTQVGWLGAVWGPGVLEGNAGRHQGQVEGRAAAAVGRRAAGQRQLGRLGHQRHHAEQAQGRRPPSSSPG